MHNFRLEAKLCRHFYSEAKKCCILLVFYCYKLFALYFASFNFEPLAVSFFKYLFYLSLPEHSRRVPRCWAVWARWRCRGVLRVGGCATRARSTCSHSPARPWHTRHRKWHREKTVKEKWHMRFVNNHS